MPWRGPEYAGELPSLGWELLEWWERYFKIPAGPHYGKPFVLTDEQTSFFVRLYHVDPEDGRFVYRRACRRGPKGKGKSPEGALFAGAEFCGPVVFDGWDANGEPVGRPRDFPWVPVAAVSEEQTDNVYLALREMLAESDLVTEVGIDVGKTRIEFTDGRPGKIEPVTASAGAREGTPYTAAVLDEPHLWVPERGGDKLARVLGRNLAKTGGRSLEVTNAPALGENSVAESTMEAADKGQEGLLYDSVEPVWPDELDPKDPENRAEVMRALEVAYGEAAVSAGGWIDLQRIYDEIMDVSVPRSDVFRFYLNIAKKAENKAFDPEHIRSTVADRPVDGPVVLAFDGARTRDCAVISGWTLDEVPHHFAVQVWERPARADGEYEHPRGEIRAAVRECFETMQVALFAFDSSFHELSSLYDEWIEEWGEDVVVGFPTASGKRMEAALLRVLEDFREGAFTHDGDERIVEHLGNAVLGKNRGGWLSLQKPKDSLKIDGAVTFTFGYHLVPTARQAWAERSQAPAMYVGFS